MCKTDAGENSCTQLNEFSLSFPTENLRASMHTMSEQGQQAASSKRHVGQHLITSLPDDCLLKVSRRLSNRNRNHCSRTAIIVQDQQRLHRHEWHPCCTQIAENLPSCPDFCNFVSTFCPSNAPGGTPSLLKDNLKARLEQHYGTPPIQTPKDTTILGDPLRELQWQCQAAQRAKPQLLDMKGLNKWYTQVYDEIPNAQFNGVRLNRQHHRAVTTSLDGTVAVW